MPSLKSLRIRITSVKSTKKITSAMKLVSGAKLKRAQNAAEASRPYSERMNSLVVSLAASTVGQGPELLSGRFKDGVRLDRVHLIIVATADKGLCGAFNGSIVREARQTIRRLQAEGKEVKLLCIGRKGRDLLRRDYGSLIIESRELGNLKQIPFSLAHEMAEIVRSRFVAAEIDTATLIYSQFKSAISQQVTKHQLIPVVLPESAGSVVQTATEFEPEEERLLDAILPRNLAVQLYRGLLENAASEQGARMTAMDNATRNAGDMIARLTLNYNRTRQAVITKELIEIISGAEAL
ncbi:MAG: F0F1 ATP synthase subunit gamma [Candidatus Pacebacteria bacterium]|nr:F0F1 ATP synthase subunit gamma [Candidatus Paceibacterota bacterium]